MLQEWCIVACKLKSDVPSQVVDTLKFLTREFDYEFNDFPDHPFFDTWEWQDLLLWPTHLFLAGEADATLQADEIFGNYHLTVRSHVKGNSDNEIEKFLHWIAPYTAPGTGYQDWLQFIGYMRNTAREHPTLIYFGRNGEVWFSDLRTRLLEKTEYHLESAEKDNY